MNTAIQTTRGYNVIFIHSSLDDAGLTTEQFRVLAHVSRRAGSGESWASNATMAKICRITDDCVRDCLKELERRKILRRQERAGKTTVWTVTPPAEWDLQPVEKINGNGRSPAYPSRTTPPLNNTPPPLPNNTPLRLSPEGHPSLLLVTSRNPTLKMAKLQAAKIGLSDIEAEKFFNYYESNGWRVGRNPMKSWTAAMNNWKSNVRKYGKNNQNVNPRNLGIAQDHAQQGRDTVEVLARREREAAAEREALQNEVAG